MNTEQDAIIDINCMIRRMFPKLNSNQSKIIVLFLA